MPGLRFFALTAGLVGALIVLWLIGFVVFVGTLSEASEPTRVADGIVVLTGGDTRLNEAVGLLAQKKGQRLLISGVNPSTPDADVRRLLDDSDGLFDCCIDLGRSATDTSSNAAEAAEWVKRNDYASLILVTADYHMPRSLLEFELAMPDVELIAFPIQSDNVPVDGWWRHPRTLRFLLAEYNKYMIARLRTRLSSFL